MTKRVSIQTGDFNLADEVEALRKDDKRVGAVCSFIGTVRDRNDGLSISSMELEHYPGMTEKAIEAMIDEACSRFDIFGARVIHRVGLSRSTRSSWWPSPPPTGVKASRPASF